MEKRYIITQPELGKELCDILGIENVRDIAIVFKPNHALFAKVAVQLTAQQVADIGKVLKWVGENEL